MRQVRQSVFETNSSSTHSISINHSTKLRDTLFVDDSGIVTVVDDEFGWETATYSDAKTKASYAYTFCRYSPNLLDMLTSVIMEHTGAINVVYVDNDGYIDHQSLDVGEDAFESETTLKSFLFNRGSILMTGNNNDY